MTIFHLDIVRRSVRRCDKPVVALEVPPSQAPLFWTGERIALVREVLEPIARQARCGFDAMICDAPNVATARRIGATLMIHGVRDGIDLDHEMEIAGSRDAIALEVHPVFVPASAGARSIAATVVREFVEHGADIASFVPPAVLATLKHKLGP